MRRARFLVLDEADRMLDMGFINDVDAIVRRIPMSRQTLLFSATFPPEIRTLSERYLMHPETVRIDTAIRVKESVEHAVLEVPSWQKVDLLLAVLDRDRPAKCLVFTATREMTTELARRLRTRTTRWSRSRVLLSQANRERALTAFRNGVFDVLVATDVAARGLDIDDIDLVVNFRRADARRGVRPSYRSHRSCASRRQGSHARLRARRVPGRSDRADARSCGSPRHRLRFRLRRPASANARRGSWRVQPARGIGPERGIRAARESRRLARPQRRRPPGERRRHADVRVAAPVGTAMGTLRIVAGRLRGRRLRLPADATFRPTSDRVRESLFNILGQDLSGFDVLDLFAGSGAIGFEALSRGARRVVFVEANARTASALRRVAEELGCDREIRVIVGKVEDVLDRTRLGGPYHIIVADPPYDALVESTLVDAIDASGLLGLHGTLVVERESRNRVEAGGKGLRHVRTAVYGRTALDFFKYQ
jgi:16S rRNA (guanine(966)-N(2))-methyltransferase RsmD